MKEITLEEAYQYATDTKMRVGNRIEGLDLHNLRGENTPARFALEVGAMDAALICHAFNVLPEVVEALTELEYRVSCALGVTTKLPQNPLGEAMNKALSALAKAKTVKVPWKLCHQTKKLSV